MANFKLANASEVAQWSNDYAKEYVRDTPFSPYMSTRDDAVIRVKNDLTGQSGAVIHIPYIGRLTGAGVTGGAKLYDSEEQMPNYSCAVRATLRRNAVGIQESETFRTVLDVADAARYTLKNWSAERLRDDLIAASQSLVVKGGLDADNTYIEDTYLPFAASGAAANSFVTNNADRLLFGNANGNLVAGNMANSLLAVTAGMKLSAGVLNLAKTKAQLTTTLKINPIRVDSTAGREWFVLFVGPEGYADLAGDPTILAANKDARERGVGDNPIFLGGDLLYNGIIIRQVVEMPVVGTVGASSARVGHAVLCGANAMALSWAKKPEPRVQTFDYGHQNNCAIMEIRGQNKFSVAGVQTGMVSIFHAANAFA
ncbi:hypothetical protein ASG11_17770 [Sphingomonas sp. Leaf357]|uniref:phage capsid family protein n=1 Tax=Sphingomonas sp. Leaf357 TaxID=1736350 RepID=UPI000701C7A9|nr:DUF4043 family protein [Sphingomonas sp. Leaf357]KQS01502.1 hypothetical protein ASG11_17770 [Sphingomonas sp. Leaf357]